MIRVILCITLLIMGSIAVEAKATGKVKYPGGKFFIWRYTLKDKQGSTYTIEHPNRWLSRKAIERRKRQALPLDSTDLPVSSRYLKLFEKTSDDVIKINRKSSEYAIIGTSRWNNTILVRSNDTTLFRRLASLECVSKA